MHELLSLDMENEEINSQEPELTIPLGKISFKETKMPKKSRIRACLKSDFSPMKPKPQVKWKNLWVNGRTSTLQHPEKLLGGKRPLINVKPNIKPIETEVKKRKAKPSDI